MLEPRGFLVILLQLSLVTGMNAGWSVQRTPCSSESEDRANLQRIPPRLDPLRPDPGDAGKWPVDPCKDIKPKVMSPINQTVPSYVEGTGLIKEDFPVSLTWADSRSGFIFSHNDTVEAEMMYQPHMIFRTGGDTVTTHQTIVIMEEDPAVIEAATYLFERHPTISTLLRYHKEVLHIVRGQHSFFTRSHDVMLVGHGSSRSSGTVQFAGYGPEDLARFVSTLNAETTFGHLGAISLISCNIGNDQHFMSQLLQALRSLGVETKLHLHKSFLSVSSEGEILTRTNAVWRSHDHSRRVLAELDQRGVLLTRVELGCAGPLISGFKGKVLYLQTLEWPSHPQMFVPMELRKKYPSIDCLEGLTWSLFFEENERRRAPDYVLDKGLLKAVWLTEPGPKEDNIVFKHINDIQDLLVEIRYNGMEEATSDLFYVLNECIYHVHGKNLSVSLVGKFMSAANEAEIEKFRQNFNYPQVDSSLQELRQGLKASKFNDFCRQTFQFQQCNFNCERWGHYFMVAVFSASVRNFRTFSLFLMSVIGCEVGRLRGTDSPLCTAFVGTDHPMVTDLPWPEPLRRGFYGCSVENFEMAPTSRQIWLDQVVAKENALYIKSKQMMNTVDHDEQTELEIFGRVKVMNKYVFSSYLEFFRGTPEGKKLKRGCTAPLNEIVNP